MGEPGFLLDFALLIPCFNDTTGLIRSLKTVKYESKKFLIVVVDDGSQQPIHAEELNAHLPEHFNIIVLRNQMNLGITKSLNYGLEWIETNSSVKYIARLDCNDTCREDRFIKEVAFLDCHENIGLVGTWCKFSDRSGTHYLYKTPLDSSSIRRAMYFRNVFIHPTVMWRSKFSRLVGFYPMQFPHCEDYALFWKLLKITDGAILSELLVVTQLNHTGISLKNRNKQFLNRIKVVLTFGTNPLFQLASIVRITALSVIPTRLALLLKTRLKS